MATLDLYRFPTEVQDLIWLAAITGEPPRLVELDSEYEGVIKNKHGHQCGSIYNFFSTATVPGVLHACSRSRQLAMRRWTLSFRSGFATSPGWGSTWDKSICNRSTNIPRTWFDAVSDILVFLGEYSTSLDFNIPLFNAEIRLPEESRKLVRNVAFLLDGVIREDPFARTEGCYGLRGGELYARAMHRIFPCTTKFFVILGQEIIYKADLKAGFVSKDIGTGTDDWIYDTIISMRTILSCVGDSIPVEAVAFLSQERDSVSTVNT